MADVNDPKNDRWIEGFKAAEKEFIEVGQPRFENPYPEGSDAYLGFEEAVYIFTQK